MIIFLDMDGVLSDFDKYVCETHKFGTKEKWNDQWDHLPERMFNELEKMPDADDLFSYCKVYNPQILTAIPKKDKVRYARTDKLRWMKRHYDVKPWHMNVVYREEKLMFAVDDFIQPNILVDDNESNIDEWTKQGGAGVLHTSAETSIAELQKLGF